MCVHGLTKVEVDYHQWQQVIVIKLISEVKIKSDQYDSILFKQE